MIKDNRTIVEITNTHIKILQIKNQLNAPALTQLDIIETKNHTDQQLIDLITRCSIKTKTTILVIPKRHVILKQFSMPSLDETEIHKMLALKILQEVPFTQEEIVFDKTILEKTKDGYTKVLAAISPIDQISNNFNVLQKSGLTVTNVFISSFGIIGWFQSIFPDEKKTIGILNLDHDGTELCCCSLNKFLFSRNFSSGLSDLTDKNMPDMIHQLELTMKAYKLEHPKQPLEKIYIVSDVFQIELLKNSIIQELKIPVETIKPSERISCELQVLSLIKNNPMVSLTAAWGFVLAGIEHQIDLMPHTLNKHQETPLFINSYIKFLISLSVFIVLILGTISLGTYQKYLQAQQLQNKLDLIQVKAQNETEKLENIQKILSLPSKELPLADLLKNIFESAGQGLIFKRLILNQDNTFIIEGLSPDQNILGNFQKKLQSLPWFNTVDVKESRNQAYAEKELVEFKIVCQVINTQKKSK